MSWYTRPLETIYDELDTTSQGLSTATADQRRERAGPNEITGDHGRGPLRIFLAQFSSALIWVLLVAAVLSFAIGHIVDVRRTVESRQSLVK